MGNKKKISSAFFVTILVFSIFATLPFAAASPDEVIYVPDDYATIQEAVDAASPGDTIIVRDGTYTENVNVDKQLTIQSENGSANCIVQANNSNEHVFNVTANYVNISGFTVEGATEGWPYYAMGIYINSSNHCNVSNNIVKENYGGIVFVNSSENNIVNNKVSLNGYGGSIYLKNSSNNLISNNTVSTNNFHGIYLESSPNTTLTNNNASNNSCGYIDVSGVYLFNSDNCTIKDNIASNNLGEDHGYGIYVSNSRNCLIENNTASGNGCYYSYPYGIGYGVYFQSSGNITLTDNNASNNTFGFYLEDSSNNTIFNNYFKNTNNAYDNGNNIWNISKTPGTNIVGDSWLGGNYWSDYAGKDLDEDGLGDTLLPYNSSGNITTGGDWLPLVKAEEESYTKTDIGVTSNITLANSSDLLAYLPPEYAGMDIGDAVVLNVNVTDNTPENSTDDAYTDITIKVDELDIETCKVFKTGIGFLPEVDDVATLPTLKPPGEPAFSRDLVNETVTVRLYVGDPLLGVIPPVASFVFDTGPSENPYPSIMGTHNGTIIPSVNITVNKMYTYPCTGTGGHTESFELYENDELIANGTWSGYVGDWHNITIHNVTDGVPYVTLLKGHKYNYTIITGSYPQIIHEHEYEKATGGTITCTLFMDANGKTYTDWIPAIRLEY